MYITATHSFTFLYPDDEKLLEKFVSIIEELDDGKWTGDFSSNTVTYTHKESYTGFPKDVVRRSDAND